MNRYNLSEIMKAAHNMYATGKYTTFADALRRSWKVAKNRIAIEERREATEAYFAAKKQEQADNAAWSAKVEAESKAYGYGLGNHYSMLSGWGNYCGD